MKFRIFFCAALIAIAAIVFAAAPKQESKPTPMTSPGPERDSKAATTSIALRVRRITYEDAYVAVPVTDAIMKKNTDGTAKLDFEAFVAEAIQISKDKRVEWKVESTTTEAHSVQQPLPKGRKCFDPIYDESKQR